MSENHLKDKLYQKALIGISGWCRLHFHDQSKLIPTEIIQIITRLYYNDFKWDMSLYEMKLHVMEATIKATGRDINDAILIFSNNDQTVESCSFATNYYIPSSNILSSDIHSFVKWQVTIDEMPLFLGKHSFSGCIGYVEYPYHNKNNQNPNFPHSWNYWLGNDPYRLNHFSLSYGCELKGGDPCMGTISSKWSTAKIDIGGKFEIHFDFDKFQSLFYYNDEFMGIMYTGLPSKLVPAVVICNGHIVTTTKWELVYRARH